MFTDELKKARKAKGLTQKAVAEALKIDNSTYCGYETGKREPDIARLREIADLLDIDVSQLLFGDTLNGAQYAEFRRRITDALPFFSNEDQEIIGINSREILDGFRSRKPIRIEKAKSLASVLSVKVEDIFSDPKFTNPSPMVEYGADYFEQPKPSAEARLIRYYEMLSPANKEKALSYLDFLRSEEHRDA